MSLMDVLRGMANGPRGPAAPGGRGGISPITMGLLALLAYKTMRGEGPLGGLFRQGNAPAGNAPPAPTQVSFADPPEANTRRSLAAGAVRELHRLHFRNRPFEAF
jgi:hypothetical protein